MTHGRHETQWLTISLGEYESMKAAIETLSSKEAMEKVARGEEELLAGKGKRLGDLKKELGL